jgi:hypothetical protein
MASIESRLFSSERDLPAGKPRLARRQLKHNAKGSRVETGQTSPEPRIGLFWGLPTASSCYSPIGLSRSFSAVPEIGGFKTRPRVRGSLKAEWTRRAMDCMGSMIPVTPVTLVYSTSFSSLPGLTDHAQPKVSIDWRLMFSLRRLHGTPASVMPG